MAHHSQRGIAVLDVGSTNVKATLFDSGLCELASRSVRSKHGTEPYLCIDLDLPVAFARDALADFDRICPVDTIVPSAHGSALALLDEHDRLALPMMSYEASPPAEICAAYDELAPSYDEVYAPTNPAALTLGRQLLWQQTRFAGEFSAVKTIVPLGQYIGFALGGELASEVTALGAQTHLWDPVVRDFSKLAKTRGWAQLFAGIRPAWKKIGEVCGLKLNGRGEILTGIHDSNANYYLYSGSEELCLLSTGTWMIAFDRQIPITKLQADFDQVSNTDLYGQPVSCCRFMAGREFEIVADGESPDQASIAMVETIIGNGVFALPSFTDSGGPVPGTGNQGRLSGKLPDLAGSRASMASLYCAQMTAAALHRLGTHGRIVVDGPFAANAAYVQILAGLLPDCTLWTSSEKNGTARGAAKLALMDGSAAADIPVELTRVQPAGIDGLGDYHREWLSRV